MMFNLKAGVLFQQWKDLIYWQNDWSCVLSFAEFKHFRSNIIELGEQRASPRMSLSYTNGSQLGEGGCFLPLPRGHLEISGICSFYCNKRVGRWGGLLPIQVCESPRMLFNVLQCKWQPPQQRIIRLNVSVVLGLRSRALGRVWQYSFKSV